MDLKEGMPLLIPVGNLSRKDEIAYIQENTDYLIELLPDALQRIDKVFFK